MVLDRDPGVHFDLLALSGPPATTPPTSNQPSWCVCSHCRDMPTDLEKKCCQQPPQTCISTVPHMEEFILQNGVLRLARTFWNEFRAVYDDPDPGEDNRQFRHAAYRQFVAWQHGKLGGGRRVVIPSCGLEDKGKIP
ncbi:P2X purinoceptor 7-like [Nothobranchius furzeri]|uniref:P2X purinoceptor 7-like n=1 Tax=Nothobranchius furzeri TaxID=105023 RepID=UPI003904A878